MFFYCKFTFKNRNFSFFGNFGKIKFFRKNDQKNPKIADFVKMDRKLHRGAVSQSLDFKWTQHPKIDDSTHFCLKNEPPGLLLSRPQSCARHFNFWQSGNPASPVFPNFLIFLRNRRNLNFIYFYFLKKAETIIKTLKMIVI